MFDLEKAIITYLEYCQYQKKLSDKTIKAYRIDLNQFQIYAEDTGQVINRVYLSNFITGLHKRFKPKTTKRKIAALKAFFAYLEYEEVIQENPFSKIKVKFREPSLLPKTISVENLQKLFYSAYHEQELEAVGTPSNKSRIRDIAVLELLFATGIRVSELSFITLADFDLNQGKILIQGKGSKERMIQITNVQVLKALSAYCKAFSTDLKNSQYLFVNRIGKRLSEQSIRFMIKRYAEQAGIAEKVTPHMFRHTFATMLLEEDVDIRYIQQILGHSSILTTQIYTHVALSKQREILTTKHPRNKITF
ncbi:tyrosine-type recombinase/integrase [Aminipila butyrica]|uniref:Tyrosine-type recombinase/integrase n=1 Tax=Aminipila butyrica TaxID=433296 RepID=A0A858BWE6_9FIRM|nr:tyrosine-type recombinase/integrase [Aminipila butyrica]QIB69509.1 tyrosine-type recombinase/integrase [Aminipila butyrica]